MAYTSISLQDVMNHLTWNSKMLSGCIIEPRHDHARPGISYVVAGTNFAHKYFMPYDIYRGSYNAIVKLTEEIRTLDESLDLWLNGRVCL